MNITYVGHACLYVETHDARIVFDPWLDGPAYANQWNIFPKPVDRGTVDHSQFVLISHGHEDHLHEPTLRGLPKDKALYYPYYWHGGTFSFLRELGFRQTVEAKSGKTYQLSPSTSATFIVNGQDSIVIIERDGRVLVNCNDALHSSDLSLIDLYTDRIKRRWPKIDLVFCGFGGASYFPNTFHCPNKDDIVIGRLREQFYVHNFCRIIERLDPEIAVPFAADFALLAPHQKWINAVRFPREEIPEYYNMHFGKNSPRIMVMYPGDKIVAKELLQSSSYRPGIANGHLADLLRAQYPAEVSAFCTRASKPLSLDLVAATLKQHFDHPGTLRARYLHDVRFAIHLLDMDAESWINVHFKAGKAAVTRGTAAPSDVIAIIETMGDVLMSSLTSDWGADSLVIGYACEIKILDAKYVREAHYCAELLTRYPSPVAYALRHPIRAVRYLIQSNSAVRVRLENILKRLTKTAPWHSLPISSDAWLVGDEKAIRENYSLPRLR